MMRLIIISILLALLVGFAQPPEALSQAKKPTLMVVPSDAWCNEHGFMQSYDNQGVETRVPDYRRAMQENTDLLLAISKINELMAERGFPLKNLESVLKSLETQSAEEAMLMSRSGSQISESPIDILRKTARADIWLQLTWSVNEVGPKRSLTFNLQGIDAYSNKQIAGSSGTGPSSFSSELPVLIEEAVLANLDQFNSQLQSHFDDLFENGREVKIQLRVWDSAIDDFESYVGEDDEELGIIIEDWMYDNTVNQRFSTSVFTANMLVFEQVRIPLFDDRGRALDARRWARDLRKYLRDTLGIESKLMTRGLGEVVLIIGEK